MNGAGRDALGPSRLGTGRGGGLAAGRRGRRVRAAPLALRRACALSGRRAVCAGLVRRGAGRGVRRPRDRGAADRPADPALPSAARQPVGVLPDAHRRRRGRCVDLRRGLLSPGRGHAAGAAVPGVPRVSGQHGRGGAGRRRLRVHGDVGNHGACRRSSWSRPTTAFPRSAAPATSTCWSRTSARSASCCASACCRPTPATTPSPTCARSRCRRSGRSIGFVLALFGFGAKAGILPLHVWLPEAHPAAPSPVSALMSGVMLKTAIYGMLRVTFDLLASAALVVGRRCCWRSAWPRRCSAWCSPRCRST